MVWIQTIIMISNPILCVIICEVIVLVYLLDFSIIEYRSLIVSVNSFDIFTNHQNDMLRLLYYTDIIKLLIKTIKLHDQLLYEYVSNYYYERNIV